MRSAIRIIKNGLRGIAGDEEKEGGCLIDDDVDRRKESRNTGTKE